MAFIDCFKITGGILMGEIIASTSSFPQQGYISSSEHRSQNETQWLLNPQWIAFNNEYNKMIDVLDILRTIGTDETRVLAEVPIYAGIGNARTQTGTFSITATRRNYAPDYYEFRGHVKDMNNTELGGDWGNATGIFQYGGAWDADTTYQAMLALCEWSNGLGASYIGFYVQMQERCNQPYNGEYGSYYWAGGPAIRMDTLETQFGIRGNNIGDPIPFSPEFGPASATGGGYIEDNPGKGSFDDHSDLIDLTPLPTYNPCDAQFLKVWLMDATDLAHLGDALFPQYDLSNLDILGTWKEIAEMLLNNKRVDYMLDLLIVPVEPPHATNKQHITCGGWVLYYYGNEEVPVMHYVDGKLVQNCYTTVECGSVSIPEYWANFLDFTGTKIKVFLPYVGYVDLQPEYIIGGELTIKYRFNVYDGSFMCYLFSKSGHSELNGSLVGQYAGVAAVHLPLQSQDYSQKISGLISSMGTVIAGAASGGVSAASGAGATANLTNTLVSKPGSAHANGYNASSSFLSHKRPYLIVERQRSQFSEKYPEEVGLPLNVKFRLGDLSGLTKCETAHLDTIPATVEVKEKISQLLRDGVIL